MVKTLVRSLLLHLLLHLLTITVVSGCAAIPGETTSSRSFTITGFSLPVPMAYSTAANVPAQAVGISTSADGARASVRRIVMQAVFDVLEHQGRAAGLSEPIIQIILGQLTVSIAYEPLQCGDVTVNHRNPAIQIGAPANNAMPRCIIFGNTVTAICKAACTLSTGMGVEAIPATALSIKGTLSTTNAIMANWSTEMWQGVVNRVIRTLATGPYGWQFLSASATVS